MTIKKSSFFRYFIATTTLVLFSIFLYFRIFSHKNITDNTSYNIPDLNDTETKNTYPLNFKGDNVSDIVLNDNNKLPFTYSYPQGWKEELKNKEYTLTNTENNMHVRLYAFSYIKYEDYTLDEWYNSISTNALYDHASDIIKREVFTIDNITGVLLTESFNSLSSVIYIPYKKQIIRIIIDPDFAIDNTDVKYILSSFKFID